MGPVVAKSFPFLASALAPLAGATYPDVSWLADRGRQRPHLLPAVVSEGFVGLGHAVHVFLLLDRSSAVIGCVEQLVSQLVNHAFLATPPAVGQNPANRQRSAAVGVYLDRDLVVGAADAAALHLQYRLGVFHRLLEQLDRLIATLLFELLHG